MPPPHGRDCHQGPHYAVLLLAQVVGISAAAEQELDEGRGSPKGAGDDERRPVALEVRVDDVGGVAFCEEGREEGDGAGEGCLEQGALGNLVRGVVLEDELDDAEPRLDGEIEVPCCGD